GSDSFTYKVCDNGQSGSPRVDDFKCSTAVATITITPVNDAPVAVADAKTTAEDTPANVYVLANDTPGPANESSQVLNIDSITVSPLHGTATINDHGTPLATGDDYVVYSPAADYFGSDSFTYKVCDNGQSGSPLVDDFKCSTAVATITITPVNDAPVAVADPPSQSGVQYSDPIAKVTITSSGDVDSTAAVISASIVGWKKDGDSFTPPTISAPALGGLSLAQVGVTDPASFPLK